MHQRGYRYSCKFAKVFIDTKTDMYLFCHFAPPFFTSSVFFGLCCFLFCRAAPFEKLFYILAVITAELVLPVFIQAVKKVQPLPSAALTQLQQLQQQAHFLQRVLLLFVSLGIMCLCPLGRRFSVQQCFQAAAQNIGAAHQQL